MGHNLVAVCSQFPQLIINRNKQEKQCFKCFAVNNKNNNPQKPSIFSIRLSSFHPFSESPKASFDEYIEDEARLPRATFSGKSEKLNQDERRVHMPCFQLLFRTVSPIADVRLHWSSAQHCPIHIPHHVSKFLSLRLIRWELKGLGIDFKSQNFTISVKGALYAERIESKSILTSILVLNLHNLPAPTPLDFFAQDFLQSLVEKGARGMMEETMHEFTEKLLLDYSKYKEEKQNNEVSVSETSSEIRNKIK